MKGSRSSIVSGPCWFLKVLPRGFSGPSLGLCPHQLACDAFYTFPAPEHTPQSILLLPLNVIVVRATDCFKSKALGTLVVFTAFD
jgi:hypothetical protein